MGLDSYLFYSVMGISVVFLALVSLMVIIMLLTFVSQRAHSAVQTEAKEAHSATVAKPSVVNLAPGTTGEVQLFDTEPREAAMIMAIVADELQKPLNELRFVSIREVKE